MAHNYTPTTEEVRETYRGALIQTAPNIYALVDKAQADAEFDRWIAEVKAKAWQEGAVWQRANAVPDDRRMKVRFVSELQAVNPYQEGEK